MTDTVNRTAAAGYIGYPAAFSALLYFITLFNFLNFAFCRLILRNAMLIIVSRRC